MNSAAGVILSLSYILGLLSTAVWWGKYAVLALGIGAAFLVPQFWRTGPKAKVWLAVGILGLLAALYFQARVPQPLANDISKFVHAQNGKGQEQVVTVQGKIASTPRLTQSQRSQFWLEASKLNEVKNGENKPADVSQGVTGKLYVTVPLLQATGLYPGEAIAITGVLYKPKKATNPGAFDFQAYLAREGGFAGLSGRQVSFPNEQEERGWGFWTVRQRIIHSQVRWLGSPEGQLVSSMVMGSQAVDLPYDVRNQFIQVGLAHTLAASGFQISLILGFVIAAFGRFSVRTQLGVGLAAILIFICLTGVQPSVLRAGVMGVGALIALAMQRKVKPLGSLLLAATVLLLFNPLWIWNLGFQLSFLATLGLLVTLPAIIKWFDWLPPAIASLFALPIAVLPWVLPLQLFVFGVVSPYSILANIISTPFLSVISIGGILSALAGLIWPLAGSTLAWLLYYPTHWLILLVQFFSSLPGNSIAVGTISIFQVLVLYGLIGLAWLSKWWCRRWWFAAIIATTLVVIPVWQTKATLFRVTVLSTPGEPVLVIQDKGQVTLVNSGDDSTANFTVLPFLQQQGVNQIDWAVVTDSQLSPRSGWAKILERLPVSTFYVNAASMGKLGTLGVKIPPQALPVGQSVPIGTSAIKLINSQPPVVQLQISDQSWLVLGNFKPEENERKLALLKQLPPVQVLWWSGESLQADVLQKMQPKVAIASSATIDPETAQTLRKINTKLYTTERDGAIQWTPSGAFETTLEATENDVSISY
ncbi:ComEC/Rec2 family competence protein [Cyanobacteria bacterium FACHB-472]|nr:ComEC/Rec2 family competence protein [Cyanobacteria bacterium FACHB-472]